MRAALLALVMLAADAYAAQAVPAVYQDEYVSIHAGVADTGMRPIHLGDAISFVARIVFDSSQVRIETLDDDFFKRAFAGPGNFQLYAPAIVTQVKESGGQIEIHAAWPFQVLGCPENLTTCPGDKIYELPVISVSYQIIDETGEVVNDKSARFRPWPGRIAVVSALAVRNGRTGEFEDYFPRGAHAQAMAVSNSPGTGMVAVLAGILLVVVGLNKRQLGNRPQHHVMDAESTANRWQRALSTLQNDLLPDDQWADLLRRCASWYCADELGRNPHAPLATDFDEFFSDILSEESIAAERRGDFLARFAKLAGEDT